MKVVFDHNVPLQLRSVLGSYLVLSAGELEWNLLSNGNLMKAAQESGFTVLVTCDSDFLAYKNSPTRTISIVYLSTNHKKSLLAAYKVIRASVEASSEGSFDTLSIPLVVTRKHNP